MALPDASQVFANRTLNLRSIEAIGYDLDYTLVHYRTSEWEGVAYDVAKAQLAERGWPVAGLRFDPTSVIQGLTIDLEHGNLVKATRFGYVIKAAHGTRSLDFGETRRRYAGTAVDLGDPRWLFLNTLFSHSEAALYAQVVDLLDAGEIPETLGYEDLFSVVHDAVDAAHAGGGLKERILADPDRFVDHDPRVVPTLLDQRAAGKRLLLITNSDWAYASAILDRYITPDVPDGEWRDLFDVVVVAADKPGFFSSDQAFFEVVDEREGLLRRHHGPLEAGRVYSGGSAAQVEASLGLSGDEVLYVGDHLFGDVHVSKAIHRWRTALVIRELEDELAALEAFAPTEQQLTDLMVEKGGLEARLAARRLALLHGGASARADEDLAELNRALGALDERIAPLAIASGELHNPSWGLLMRAGLDKSLFARQVERYADVYTSRVAHLRDVTPYGMLRAAWTSLPHD